MKKRFFAILSIFAATVVLVALVPGCDGAAAEGTIEVKATYYGEPWAGTMYYDLIPAEGAIVDGDTVPGSHTVATGSWAIEVQAGGPTNGYVVSITPGSNLSVSEGGTTTFTVDFARAADARLEGSVYWTINGEYAEGSWAPFVWHVVSPGDVIGLRFQQRYEAGASVNLTESAWCGIYHESDWQDFDMWGRIHIANADCAVNKTPTYDEGAKVEKLSQAAGLWEYYALPPCTSFNLSALQGLGFPPPTTFNWTFDMPTIGLNEYSVWSLDSGVLYDKAIDWLVIGSGDWVAEECALFQLVEDQPWPTLIVLLGYVSIAMEGAEDAVPGNNAWATYDPPLCLYIP